MFFDNNHPTGCDFALHFSLVIIDGFPGGASGKEPIRQCRRDRRQQVQTGGWENPMDFGNPLQYSCLENPMDRREWWAMVHGVPKSRT